jgi:hypothetical protein
MRIGTGLDAGFCKSVIQTQWRVAGLSICDIPADFMDKKWRKMTGST